MPRPYPATRSVVYHPRGHASPVSGDAQRRLPSPRPCLARIRRRPASPTIPEAMPRPHPATRSVVYHPRGHASPVSGDAQRRPPSSRPCLARIRRRAASSTIPEAMPRPYPATRSVVHHPRGHASPASGDAQRRLPSPRPCLARIRRRAASSTIPEAMPRPHPMIPIAMLAYAACGAPTLVHLHGSFRHH